MKRLKIIFAVVLLCSLWGPVQALDLSEDIDQIIVGKWNLEPNKVFSSGTILFDEHNRYEMNQKPRTSSGFGTKGEYQLNCNAVPMQIDLCLDQCGKAGSEWTTRFGIIRVLSVDKLEIHISRNSEHPTEFPDAASAELKMILIRAK